MYSCRRPEPRVPSVPRPVTSGPGLLASLLFSPAREGGCDAAIAAHLPFRSIAHIGAVTDTLGVPTCHASQSEALDRGGIDRTTEAVASVPGHRGLLRAGDAWVIEYHCSPERGIVHDNCRGKCRRVWSGRATASWSPRLRHLAPYDHHL